MEERALSLDLSNELLQTLEKRFEKYKTRHVDLKWAEVLNKLNNNKTKLWSLNEMERTGGAPDVIDYDKATDEYIFCDCSEESPTGRRSLCYDREGMDSRKEFKPENTSMDMAADMGIEILDESQYRKLQEVGSFDTKTSSWIKTPDVIRKQGGALFADCRYGHVFIYHNGAQSYYGGRGFRGLLRV